MHAATIEKHQDLKHQANELVTAWSCTDPLHSVDDVRRAVAVDTTVTAADMIAAEPGSEAHELNLLALYVADVARERGLLIPAPDPTVAAKPFTKAEILGGWTTPR